MRWSPCKGTADYDALRRAGATDEALNTMSLHTMCDHGVREFHGGRTDCIRFDVFNAIERDIVQGYMAEKHAGVKFFCTWMDWPRYTTADGEAAK